MSISIIINYIVGNITVMIGGNDKLPLSTSSGRVCSSLQVNTIEGDSQLFDCQLDTWFSTITILGQSNTSLSLCNVNLIGKGTFVILLLTTAYVMNEM